MTFRPDPTRGQRGAVARVCDTVTVVVFVAALLSTIGAVCYLGPAQARDRLGCGVVDLVNRSLDTHDACHAPAKTR